MYLDARLEIALNWGKWLNTLPGWLEVQSVDFWSHGEIDTYNLKLKKPTDL